MTEKTAIARPYAKAAFEIALEKNVLDAWSRMLQMSADIVSDSRVNALLTNPHVRTAQITKLIFEVGGDTFDQTAKNFIEFLAKNKRLNVLPEIFDHYKHTRSAHEKKVDVEVATAFPISPNEQSDLTKVLKIRLQRDVSLKWHIDRTLLGGVIIRAEDLVIDASVKSKMSRLLNELMV